MSDPLSRESVIRANQYVHASIVEEYDESPHFRPENKARVRGHVEELVRRLESTGMKPDRVIDFCCGTGFMISLMHDCFRSVVGVDVTQEMLDRVDTSPGNIELINGPAEKVDFPDDHFDMATAYSCLDHLLEYRDFLSEAYRVLKPGGLLYVDLNPNRGFWQMLEGVKDAPNLPPNLATEVYNTLSNDERNSEKYQIDIDQLVMAEPTKNYAYGFDEDEVGAVAKEIGFANFETHHHWFLNEGVVLHEHSPEEAKTVDAYLRMTLPASKNLFKYLGFVFTK